MESIRVGLFFRITFRHVFLSSVYYSPPLVLVFFFRFPPCFSHYISLSPLFLCTLLLFYPSLYGAASTLAISYLRFVSSSFGFIFVYFCQNNFFLFFLRISSTVICSGEADAVLRIFLHCFIFLIFLILIYTPPRYPNARSFVKLEDILIECRRASLSTAYPLPCNIMSHIF